MIFTETKLKGAFIIDVDKREDERGFFGRIWCRDEMRAQRLEDVMVQASVSWNHTRGTLRGMHYQIEPYAECKWVRCTSGALYDVIVDLRPESSTYKQWVGVELTAENFRTMYVPERFAHGFITLEANTSVHYMVSQFYTPGSERGIRFDDPGIDIQWPIEPVVISAKDRSHPFFESLVYQQHDSK